MYDILSLISHLSHILTILMYVVIVVVVVVVVVVGPMRIMRNEKRRETSHLPHKMYEKWCLTSIYNEKCARKDKNNKWNVKEMNIFYLSNDPVEIAKQLCDKHIVKMPLESAQMLSTAWWGRANYGESKHILKQLYKPVHIGHPSTMWTMQTEGNYRWHYKLFVAMLDEYSRRYNKVHASSKLLELLKESPTVGGEFYPPPQCMPDEYKTDDTILAYRNYYINEKARFARYTNGTAPEWLEEYL